MKQDVLGLQFDNVTMDEAVARAEELLEAPGASIVVTPNAEIGYEALHDAQFRALLNGADLVLPDGAGVVLAAKLRKTPLKQKVAGVDFADRLLGVLAETGKTLYLLGGKPGIAELAAEKMREKHPGLQICGTADGYFKDEGPVIGKINAAKPDVLFVCVGAPKQEIFMHAHRDELDVRLMAGCVRRHGEARAEVDDPLQPRMALPPDQRAEALRADDAPAEVSLGGADGAE